LPSGSHRGGSMCPPVLPSVQSVLCVLSLPLKSQISDSLFPPTLLIRVRPSPQISNFRLRFALPGPPPHYSHCSIHPIVFSSLWPKPPASVLLFVARASSPWSIFVGAQHAVPSPGRGVIYYTLFSSRLITPALSPPQEGSFFTFHFLLPTPDSISSEFLWQYSLMAASMASPYCPHFFSPTPLTSRNASSVEGRRLAISRSAASPKTT
jgi:hypothetical protein